MSGDIVARRYAGALFAIGKEQGLANLENYGATLSALSDMMVESLSFDKLLRAPVISSAEKMAVLETILAKLEAAPVMIGFCRLLAEKNRLDKLAVIAAAFGTLLDREKGIVRGTVTTAFDLDDARRETLVKDIEQKAGKSVKLDFDVDPDILGGIVLRLGDTVLDASLRAQLTALIDTIKRGE
jgi:F-type H+-transporting ATPase subunit delta